MLSISTDNNEFHAKLSFRDGSQLCVDQLSPEKAEVFFASEDGQEFCITLNSREMRSFCTEMMVLARSLDRLPA